MKICKTSPLQHLIAWAVAPPTGFDEKFDWLQHLDRAQIVAPHTRHIAGLLLFKLPVFLGHLNSIESSITVR